MFRNLDLRFSKEILEGRARELTVKNGNHSNLNHTMAPALGVLGSFLYIFHAVMTVTATIRLRKLSTMLHDCLVFVVQEVGRLVVLWNQENTHHSKHYGNDALENVKPLQLLDLGIEDIFRTYHLHPG